jgi:DNA-directed RNA polymerase subunit RPC12/RpoP
MVDFITIKCPGCGRDMQLDLINRNGSCSHCASKVNYRDAKSLPTHISAEPGEIERFAHASQALQGSENIENERSPEMSDPVLTDNGKEIDYNKKKEEFVESFDRCVFHYIALDYRFINERSGRG